MNTEKEKKDVKIDLKEKSLDELLDEKVKELEKKDMEDDEKQKKEDKKRADLCYHEFVQFIREKTLDYFPYYWNTGEKKGIHSSNI